MAEIIAGVIAFIFILIIGFKERAKNNVYNEIWKGRMK